MALTGWKFEQWTVVQRLMLSGQSIHGGGIGEYLEWYSRYHSREWYRHTITGRGIGELDVALKGGD